MGQAEAYVENYLSTQAHKRGHLCYKWVAPSTTGVPDRILIVRGRVAFVEVKSKVGSPSVKQLACVLQLRRHGALAVFVNDREHVDALISAMEQGMSNEVIIADVTPDAIISGLKKASKE